MRGAPLPAALALGVAVAVALAAGACAPKDDLPATLVAGPRILAVAAEPPEVPAGGSAIVTAWIAGAGGGAPAVAWSRCRRAPLAGQTIHPDCFADPPAAGVLEPVGEGTTVTATMPDVTPAALGLPDATGGVYLPLIARATLPGSAAPPLVAAYRLRLAPPASSPGAPSPPNANPAITGVLVVEPDGFAPLDETVPRAVRPGERLELAISLAPASAQAYPSPAASGAVVSETLVTSWFTTAGTLEHAHTGGAPATTVLALDAALPAPGATIDIYAVTRDERGGTAWARRALVLQP